MCKANERCYKRTFGLYGLEALNHRSELKIWDTFRSQIPELWFPYDRWIAEDGFYLLRLSAGSIAGSQTIADDRATIAEVRTWCYRLQSRSQDSRSVFPYDHRRSQNLCNPLRSYENQPLENVSEVKVFL